MRDLIDRREAIKAVLKGQLSEDDSLVECVEECNAMIEWAGDVLKNLPSAQSEPRWIPVTEALPAVYDDGRSDNFLVCGNFPVVFIAYYCEDGRWHDWDNGKPLDEYGIHATAWMPLPEPFQEEGRK